MDYYQHLFNPREISYLWKQIELRLILVGVSLIFVIPAMLLFSMASFLIPEVLLIAFEIAAFLGLVSLIIVVWLRLSLVFPAISVDQDLKFLSSYQRLKGHTWSFLLCVLLAGIPLIIFTLLMVPAMMLMPHSLINLSILTVVQTGISTILSIPILAVVAYTFQKVPRTEHG